MKCGTCNAEIPPAWVHCLQTNICPGCGGSIMDDFEKELLSELKGAMERMPNNPEGIAGWLISNYKMVKIGDATPTEFHVKRHNNEIKNEEIDSSSIKIKTDNPIHKFLARATNGTELIKRQGVSLKDIAAQIGSGATIDPSLIMEEDGDEFLDSDEESLEDIYPGGIPATALGAAGQNNVEQQYIEQQKLRQREAQRALDSGVRKKGAITRAT